MSYWIGTFQIPPTRVPAGALTLGLEVAVDKIFIVRACKDATMVGFREKSGKSDQMPYFSQILVGFLGHQRNLEEFSSNSEIYLHDNV